MLLSRSTFKTLLRVGSLSLAAVGLMAGLSVVSAQDATPAATAAMGSYTPVLTPDPSISGTISVLGFGAGDEVATTRLDLFKKLYPNVTVNLTEGALDPQQFLTSVASGNPPDIISIDRDILSTYAIRGSLQPLDDICIAKQGIDMSQFRQVAVNQVTVGGKTYGIPEFFNSLALIINTKALDEAGLTLDDVDTSDWNKIAELNTKLTKIEDGKVTRIGFDPKLPEFLPLWAKANGADLISADGKTAQLNDPKVVEALDFAAKLQDAAGGPSEFKAFRDTWDFFGGNNQVVADQIGVWPMEQWYINVLADVSPDAPVAFKAFTDKQGTPLTYATGSAWAIPVGSKNPDAACALAKVMTSVDAWVAAAQARAEKRAAANKINTGVYSGNVNADKQIFGPIVDISGTDTFTNGVNTILSLQDHGFAVAANPAGAEFKQAWMDAVNRTLSGEQTAQEALDQAQQEAQTALDQAWSQQGS